MRLASEVGIHCRFGVEPFGAFSAIISAEPGKILSGFGVLELVEMPRRNHIGFDLVDVPWAPVSKVLAMSEHLRKVEGSIILPLPRLPPRFRDGAFVSDTHVGSGEGIRRR